MEPFPVISPPLSPEVSDLQVLCERASELLVRTDYIGAERLLAMAEAGALAARDFDTLSRLYFPLQEARRQKRQRCGEGVIALDLVVPADADASALADRYPHGQLLLAGERSVAPAVRLREEYARRGVYAETFLAAAFPVEGAGGGGRLIVVLPRAADLSGIPVGTSVEQLWKILPAQTVLLSATEIPSGERKGTPVTFAWTMDLWERLYRPFLAMADGMPIGEPKLAAYRTVAEIDYACELAYQNASKTARELARQVR